MSSRPLPGRTVRAQNGSVTDIYLPEWFARNMPANHAALLLLIPYLHARNLRRASRVAAPRSVRA
jgi:hypothetical protein